jgi:hypothetical protein
MEVSEELGAEHDTVAQAGPGGEEVAEDLLGVPVGVDVGGALPPRSRYSARIALEVSGVAPQPQSSPKVIVPRVSGLTRRPERPSVM